MKDMIMKRLDCPEGIAVRLEKALGEISEELKPLVCAWLETGAQNDDTEYEGYSLNTLMETFDMQFTAAVLTLDWLITDPEAAKKAIAGGIR